jgi:kumamolisin
MSSKSLKGFLTVAVVAVSVLALAAVLPAVQAAPIPPPPTPTYEECFAPGASHLLVFFNLNDQAGLSAYLNNAYYNPFSPSYHDFLSANQFDARYAAPSWVFNTVGSIMTANGLNIISVGPMLLDGNGTAGDVDAAVSQLAGTPAVQSYLIGAECMPELNYAQSVPSSVPDIVQGSYVGHSPYSGSGASSCTPYETDSIGLVWLPCGLQEIYDENPLLNNNPHDTIAVVDAYGDLNTYDAGLATPVYDNLACSDLAIFSATFNLPQASCQIIYPTGVPLLTPSTVGTAEGWDAETGIDTQYSHVMSPASHILEVTASTNYDDLYASVEYVIQHQLANIISLSWGSWEDGFYCVSSALGCAPPNTADFLYAYDEIFEQAAAQGISVFASSGDYGAFDPYTGAAAASSPATDPWVTGVGGTTLNATFSGRTVFRNETAWSFGSDAYNPFIGTGGGFSLLFPETPGQQLVHISTQVASIFEPAIGTAGVTFYPQGQRGVPDLAADADPSSGVLIIQNGTFSPYVWGGTSLAAPLTAGMTALIQSSNRFFPIGDLAPTLYTLYAQEHGRFYVPSMYLNVNGLSRGIPGAMFETNGGENGVFYVTPGVWNPVAGLGQLNVYGMAQVIGSVGFGGFGFGPR